MSNNFGLVSHTNSSPDTEIKGISFGRYHVILKRDIVIPAGGSVLVHSNEIIHIGGNVLLKVRQTKNIVDALCSVASYELEDGKYTLDFRVSPLEDMQVTLKAGLVIAMISFVFFSPGDVEYSNAGTDDNISDSKIRPVQQVPPMPVPPKKITRDELMLESKAELVARALELQPDDSDVTEEDLMRSNKTALCDEILNLMSE